MLVGCYALEGRQHRIHFHVQPYGGDYALDLEFRNALRADPALAAEYARVKQGFVDGAPAPVDGPDYQDTKGAWILETFDRLGIRRPQPAAARRQEVGT